ncbi:MAG: 5,10-methylenetetrahydromethanopterin reductase [Candidatus Hydrothermarchaeales archaeon]
MLKFGIEFVALESPKKIAKYAKLAEDLDFDFLWITDHYNNRSLYSTLAVVAMVTEKIKLGTGVTNPYTRNIALTASEIATINEISDGRAVLGIGAGDKATFDSLGIEWTKPLATVKESVDVIRQLCDGKRVQYDGKAIKMSGKLNFKAEGIKIYVGAQGPKMLELAGKIADGVLVNASHPSDVAYAIDKVNNKDIEIGSYASVSVDKDGEKARQSAIIVVAFIASGTNPTILEKHGIDTEKTKAIGQSLAKGDFRGAMSQVDDDMIEAFCIAGTPKDVKEKIATLEKLGVTQMICGSPLGPEKENAIGILAEIKKELQQENKD